MVATQDPSLMTNTELHRDALLRRYDFALTIENRAMLAAYRARTHRGRLWGVVGALLGGAAGLLGPTDDASGFFWARLLVGYLVGSTLAEVFSPRRRGVGSVHAASLRFRRPGLLLPVWGRVLPWVVLAPCLAVPLLALGDHPTGVTRAHNRYGSSSGSASWFSTADLLTIGVFGAVGLVCWRLALRGLVRRRLPADNPEAARLDLLTRALSARAVSGSAAALGLLLLAGLGSLTSEPLHSTVCRKVGECHEVYSWHGWDTTFQTVAGLAGLAAIGLFWLSRLPRVDVATLGSATESTR